MLTRRRAVAALVVVLLGAIGYAACAGPPGPRSLTAFDPDHIADLEVEMWQAYYRKDRQIFSVPSGRVLAASTLRARAGRLRDEGGEHADWTTVSRLLHDSYRELHTAVRQ